MLRKYLPAQVLEKLSSGEASAALPGLREQIELELGRYHPAYPALLLAAADHASEQEQFARALDLCGEAAQLLPEIIDAKHPLWAYLYQLRGELLACLKQPREACYWLECALEIARVEAECDLRGTELAYVRALLLNKRFGIARELLEERCSRPAAHAEERALFALALHADGATQDAQAVATQLLPQFEELPDSLAPEEMRDCLLLLALNGSADDLQSPAAKAAGLLLKHNLISAQERFGLQLTHARGLFTRGAFDDARHSLLQLLDERQHAKRVEPEDLYDIESMLGEIEFHAHDHPQAQRHFERALQVLEQLPKLHDARARLLHNLGLLELANRKFEAAERNLVEAIRLRRTLDQLCLAESLMALGMCYKQRGETAKALDSMCEALEIREQLLEPEDELLLQAQDYVAELRGLEAEAAPTAEAPATPTAQVAAPESAQPAQQVKADTGTASILEAFHRAERLQQDSKYLEALKEYEGLLAKLEAQHGQAHADLKPILLAMSVCFRKLGFEPNAKKLEQRAAGIV